MNTHLIIIVLNEIVSLAAVAWAMMAIFRPKTLSGSEAVSSGERYFGRLYAARSVPLGFVFAVAPVAWRGDPAFLLLLLAASIQAADVVVGFCARKKDMIVGAGVATVVHILCALAVR